MGPDGDIDEADKNEGGDNAANSPVYHTYKISRLEEVLDRMILFIKKTQKLVMQSQD